MTARLLLEIGVEEMPAAAARSGLRQLAANAERLFSENRLVEVKPAADAFVVFGTPRRLTLIVPALPAAQRAEVREIKGPPAGIAFAPDGSPKPAAIGFAKSQGVPVGDLEVREADGGKYLFAVKQSAGRPAVEVLPDILRELVESLEFTKAMRWGTGRFRFIRPVRWLVALYGTETMEFEVDGLRSGRRTQGHRFLAEGPFDLTDAGDYQAVMAQGKVAVDHIARQAHIKEMVEAAARDIGGRAFADPADLKVLEEVTFLVEEPHVVMGEFNDAFLAIPRAVLVTAMKSHQRYFPIEDAAGQLMARFAVAHNGDPAYADRIRRGHERVLRARLADAAFFFAADTKTSLESKVANLRQVVWQAKLGTLFEKTERVRSLAGQIARELAVAPADAALIDRAALLAKADLTSSMVIEFTDLQGVIGREYALVDGEDPAVAEAIFEHYLPRFAGDELPGGLVGRVVALADKLDTLAGCFLVGLIPTGSADPYSLRRQAAGVVQILAQTGWSFAILELVKLAMDGYGKDGDTLETGGALRKGGDTLEAGGTLRCPPQVAAQLHGFILARLRRLLSDSGASAEAIEAVLAAGYDIIAGIGKRVRLIDGFAGKKKLENIKLAFTRCHNLARADLGEAVDVSLFEDAAEGRLFEALERAGVEIDAHLAGAGPERAMDVLAALKGPIDEFFEAVLVMAKEERVKNNRLRLLNLCVALSERIADFSKLP